MQYVLIYLAAIVAANLSVTMFNPDVIIPINAFLLIGLDLSLRDKLHDRWEYNHLKLRMLGLIAAGGVISWLANPAAGMIAVASTAAFTSAAVADGLIYGAAKRFGYTLRSNMSNVAGAVVDSLVFPIVAFGGLSPGLALKMVVAKVVGGALWTWVLRPRLATA